MYFDLSILCSVLALLHITLYIFLGYGRLVTITNLFAVLGLIFSSAQFITLWSSAHANPFGSMSGLLLFLSQALLLAYILLFFKFKRPSIGLFIFPIAVLFIIGARLLGGFSAMHNPNAASLWLYIHLPFTIIGTAFFMVSTSGGIMYFIQERQLKNKNFGVIFRRFPPLDTIDRLINTTLYIGFYTFTIGLLAGLVWMLYSSGRINVFSPKLVFAIITWIIYSSITFYKQLKGMSPKDTALSTIVGFISVIITYIGVAFFVAG
ncbi:MAG: inner membrane protein YpjD [Deferribacterales bacterium]